MFHLLAWLVARLVYRLRVVHPQNLPDRGPVLILSNHVSYVDWMAIMAASPRPVRFVVASPFADNPWIGWLLRLAKVIPMPRGIGPRAMTHSLDEIGQALDRGDVVCMFPEGYPTRNGTMLPFHRGFEKVVEGRSVAIIPCHLDQLWGSIFSYKCGRLFWKWPMRRKYPVTVTFAARQPVSIAAPQVRQLISEIESERAKERSHSARPS